ncbi:MAG: HEAT repeat domain-containing protein, partial [bacterium]
MNPGSVLRHASHTDGGRSARRCAAHIAALAAVISVTLSANAAADQGRYTVRIDVTDSVHALGSDDLFVSGPAADQLAALGPPVLPVLQRALKAEPAAVREGIVGVLVEIPGDDATVLLVRAARDPDARVREPALSGLATRPGQAGR